MDFCADNNEGINIFSEDAHVSPWKYAYASETGTSHISSETPKQDYCLVKELSINGENFLFSAVADGAGSAKYSDKSSKYICKLFIRCAVKWLKDNEITSFKRDIAKGWFLLFQKVLHRAVKMYKLESIRDFGTTLLFSVLNKKVNIFIQIGDGVIARGNSEDLCCVFEPQNGEYINTTFFATDKDIIEKFMFEANCESIDRLVMHTDGIELISFDFSAKKPYIRFFNPFFAKFENFEVPGFNKEVSDFISGFLNCERVNQNTDDDKTLVIVSSAG